MSTCFLTSNLLQDLDPWAVSQGNRRVDITKLEFYGAKVIRDKVRCPDRSYMAAGAAVHPSSETPSVIFCTQGSLHEAAGLVCIEARRPHTARMILNNFHGKPFNSPSEIISNPVDKAVYFTVSNPTYFISHTREGVTDSTHRTPLMDTSVASDRSRNCLRATYIASTQQQVTAEW